MARKMKIREFDKMSQLVNKMIIKKKQASPKNGSISPKKTDIGVKVSIALI